MRRLTGLIFLLFGLFAATQAHAQTPAPAAPAQPLPAHMRLQVDRTAGVLPTVLVGARVRVRGTVDAFAPGQSIVVRFTIGGRRWGTKRVALRARPDGSAIFMVSYRPRRPGTLSVRAAHAATPELAAFGARARSVDVIPRRVTPRSGHASIHALQRRLRALGYVTGAAGAFDARTARAVLAFRKVAGMARTTAASTGVMRAIARGAGHFRIRFPEHGRHIEADLSRQVIALYDRGRVRRIYPTSSGASVSPTVLGSFKVYLKTPGTNMKGMVHSSYFFGNYAVHGYASVPVFPASHGCLRVPVADALSLFRWIRVGTPVDVYG